jgi:hypothetical protein
VRRERREERRKEGGGRRRRGWRRGIGAPFTSFAYRRTSVVTEGYPTFAGL